MGFFFVRFWQLNFARTTARDSVETPFFHLPKGWGLVALLRCVSWQSCLSMNGIVKYQICFPGSGLELQFLGLNDLGLSENKAFHVQSYRDSGADEMAFLCSIEGDDGSPHSFRWCNVLGGRRSWLLDAWWPGTSVSSWRSDPTFGCHRN